MPKTDKLIVLHTNDISNVSTRFRPGAAVGFAEDERDCTDKNGKRYLEYIKSNAVKLTKHAVKHPALLYLMIRERLIGAKDLKTVTNAVQESGKVKLIAAMQAYGSGTISENDREKIVTGSIINEEKLETISGKTFIVVGRLKTFANCDELEKCLTACGATLKEKPTADVDYLITNTPNSGTAKNKKAVELGIKCITEAQFNKMIGRNVQ